MAYAAAQPKWFVYALKDEWARIAYIGSTKHPERRLYQHRSDGVYQQPLRAWVAGNRHTFEVLHTHPSKQAMLEAERATIKQIAPQFNSPL